jgi:hypothetical protein
MKIPSSSSLLFATLAISSSSSSLAAPAGDAPQSEGGMSSSPSNHHMAARRGSTTTRGLRPADMEVGADTPSKRSMGEFSLCPSSRRNISNSNLSPCQPMKSRLAIFWDSGASSEDFPSLALSSKSFVSLLTPSAQRQPNPSSATAILSSFKRQSP